MKLPPTSTELNPYPPMIWTKHPVYSFLFLNKTLSNPYCVLGGKDALINNNEEDRSVSVLMVWRVKYISVPVASVASVVSDSMWPYGLLCDPMDCHLPGSSVHGFSQEEYWSEFPCPPPGIYATQGSKLSLLCLLQWQAGSLPLKPPGKALMHEKHHQIRPQVNVHL